MDRQDTQATIHYHHHGIPVSTTAAEQVLRDIREGKLNSDFWNDRYTDKPEETETSEQGTAQA